VLCNATQRNAIYIIRNIRETALRYKVGVNKGSLMKLIKRYQTYMSDCLEIELFLRTNADISVKTSIKKEFIDHCSQLVTGGSSKFFEVPLATLRQRIMYYI